jgi:hypothetical protein
MAMTDTKRRLVASLAMAGTKPVVATVGASKGVELAESMNLTTSELNGEHRRPARAVQLIISGN